MNPSRLVPAAVVTVAALYLILSALPAPGRPDELVLDEFARVPVYEGGRLKPIDTVARVDLMIINNRQSFKDKHGDSQPAIRWLLDTLTWQPKDRSSAAWEHKVFRIDNDQVINQFKLEKRPGSWRYSLAEIAPHFEELTDEAVRAEKLASKQRTVYDNEIIQLRRHLELFLKLAQRRGPLVVSPLPGTEQWLSAYDADKAAREEANADREPGRVLDEHYPTAVAWSKILAAYADKDQKAFDQAVAEFRALQKPSLPSSADFDARLEVFFNRFAPFFLCSALYLMVFVLACGAWIGYSTVLNRSAFWLTVLTLVLHSAAILTRMYLQGRPPVTNLYSSAIFIGWGCVVFGLVLETLHRNGIGNVVAAVSGGLTVMVAHFLAESSGDTIEPMQAVLATDFWLATHVVCITLGYSATILAGILGIVFILMGVLTPGLDRDMMRSLTAMIYGVLCFATLLSFVGTVLGGIWADQSWGRFWGWDPKENGALLIVLMNALILHARWAGIVKQRGMAVLAVVGTMIVGWSWFGTNQLGVGLHAYGFNDQLSRGLTIVWCVLLAFVCLGLVPLRHWRSFGQAPPPPPQYPPSAALSPPRRERRDPTAVTRRR